MSATLGGLLKDYRLQKNKSQQDVAFSLGWKETSRLSKIEQGIIEKPKRKLVNKIANILELKEREKNNLLSIGGYLPTKEEIKKIRKEADNAIKDWPYPAYILDYSWRMIHWNEPTKWVYEIKDDMEEYLKKKMPRTLEVVFDPNFIQNKHLKGKDLKEWHDFLLEKIVLFKYAQQDRKTESWYLQHVKEMMENELFRKLWPQAKLPIEKGLNGYERKKLVNAKNPKKRLDFHLLKTDLLQDPRFEATLHIPTNQETYKYFH